eukprot:4310613-Amphidinium_carterae.1
MARPCSERLVPLHPRVPGVQHPDANAFDEPAEEGPQQEGHMELGLLGDTEEQEEAAQSGGEDQHDKVAKKEYLVSMRNLASASALVVARASWWGVLQMAAEGALEEAFAASAIVEAEEYHGNYDEDADFYLGQFPEPSEPSTDSDSSDSSSS